MQRCSTKKYEEVDVSAFFYKDFKEFVIKDLSQVDKDVLFDKWVYDLSERRVKKIRSEVNKELARNLTLKGGASNWGLACEIVYKEYRNIFKEVVSYNYKDDKYKGCKDEIEAIIDIFLELNFVQVPLDKHPTDNNENLTPYFGTTVLYPVLPPV